MEWNMERNTEWNGKIEWNGIRDGTEYGIEHGTDMEWNRNYALMEWGTNTEQI